MTIDELIEKLPEVRVELTNPEQAKQWLFEYGCKVAEGYNLKPKSHPGFVKYCAIHKLAKIYQAGMYACSDPNWEGCEVELTAGLKGRKSVKASVKMEYKGGTLPTQTEYLKLIHDKSGPISGLEFLEDLK